MKLFKKIALASLLVTFALSLASCGEKYSTIVKIAEDAEVVQIGSKISDVYEQVEKGCVAVVTDECSGSGVIYKQDKATYYVVTNAHVVKDSTKFKINMGGNRFYAATLLGYDSTNDVGVLTFNIDLTDDKPYVHDIFNYEESYAITVGETVLAVGCPLGYKYYNILTTGIVSSVSEDEISSDAALNPGNSGGGLFNMAGHLIGINYKKSTYAATSEFGDRIAVEGRGYSISLSLVKKCITDIETKKTVIKRPTIGITVNSYNRSLQDILSKNAGYVDYSAYVPDGVDFGLVITAFNDEITYGKNAGLQLFDVIVEANEKPINSLEDLASLLNRMLMGETLSLKVYRLVAGKATIVDVPVVFTEE